jgi:hypothetical protein
MFNQSVNKVSGTEFLDILSLSVTQQAPHLGGKMYHYCQISISAPDFQKWSQAFSVQSV